jgi:hypothetical protein
MLPLSRVAILALAMTASHAAPTRKQQGSCLSADNAQTVATKYGELISAYSDAAADAILTPNFTDFSAGVNALINTCPQGEAAKTLPLLDPTFTSRDLFKIGQGQQPLINFEQLNLWYNCNSVTIRWKSTNTAPGSDVKPIIGLIVMETIRAPAGSAQPFMIDTVYSEFDSGSWLQNLAAAGICGTMSSVVGAAPAPASAQSSAAPAPAITHSAPASSHTSMAAIVPSNGATVHETPTASHYRA